MHSGFEEVHADDSLLILNKPSGLLSVPGRGEDKQDCLSRRVQAHYSDALIVHRLDMATSGLMVMARGPGIQRALSKLFETREVYKRYVAVVDGQLNSLENESLFTSTSTPPFTSTSEKSDDWQLIDLPIAVDWQRRPLRIIHRTEGKPSQTRWRALAFMVHSNSTRVELEPLTGRSHQLRVHLQALGHSILGDALYAAQEVEARANRLLLHACVLAFTHPASGQYMRFESPAPF